MIPFLTRIENELAQTSDPLKQAELHAERASYLVRTGEFEEANRILAFLRENYGDGRYVRVSVWIMLAEGLARFFESIDSVSRDRIWRALVVSEAAGQVDLATLCAAWLAHIEFNRSCFDSSLKLLKRCFEVKPLLPAAARLRSMLVLADASMHAGRIDAARGWYEQARLDAVDQGDQATLAAIIFNKAALSLSQLRLSAITGSIEPSLVQFVSMQVSSARNFHSGAGNSALLQLISACEARISLIRGDFSDAARRLAALLEAEQMPFGFKSDRLLLRVEYGQCLAESGSMHMAKENLKELGGISGEEMTVDDQLVFLSALTTLARRLGVNPDVVVDPEQFRRCRLRYDAEVCRLAEGLDQLDVSMPL